LKLQPVFPLQLSEKLQDQQQRAEARIPGYEVYFAIEKVRTGTLIPSNTSTSKKCPDLCSGARKDKERTRKEDTHEWH